MAKNEAKSEAATTDDLLAQFQNPNDYDKKNLEYNENAGRKASDFERLQNGKTIVRFLPGIDGEPFFYHVKFHWLGNKIVYDRQQLGPDEYNPISQHASKLWNLFLETNDERYEKNAKKLFAKSKYIYNVLIRGQGDEEDRVTVLEAGITIHKKLMKLMSDPEINDITDAFKGRDIVIEKSGEKLNTEYEVRERDSESWVYGNPDMDKGEVARKIKEIYDARKNLPELVKYPSYEEAQQALQQYREAHEGLTEDGSDDISNSPANATNNNAGSSTTTEEDADVFSRLEQDLESAASNG